MRGFFSVVVVGIAVILLIGIFYAQQSQQLSRDEGARSLVVQQSLSKEWSLAREAYSQFASDAIAKELDVQLNGPFTAGNCPSGPVANDFSLAVAAGWNDVNRFLLQNLDVNCAAIISPTLESSACGSGCSPFGDVRSQGDVFVELTCTKYADGVFHQLAYPFVLNKKIELNLVSGNICHAIVYENIQVPARVEVDLTLT